MANNVSSKGYTSSFRGSNAPGAFYVVYTSDFGATAPGAPTLTYEASSGSFASETVYVQVTWITAEGESLPSTEVGVSVPSAQGAVKVVPAAAPTNGSAVLGFRVYVSTTTADESLVLAANSYTAQVTQSTTFGSLASVYPIADITGVFVKSDPVSLANPVPVVDFSGIQPALPSVPGSGAGTGTKDYDFIVPNVGSQWKVQKPVQFSRPNGTAETVGISISSVLDCIQPSYASLTGGATYAATAVSAGAFAVINGYLFVASTAGTTAATFVGFSKFNLTKFGTTTDGTVVWTCLGKASLVRAHFSNASTSTAIPAAQEYDLFEL